MEYLDDAPYMIYPKNLDYFISQLPRTSSECEQDIAFYYTVLQQCERQGDEGLAFSVMQILIHLRYQHICLNKLADDDSISFATFYELKLPKLKRDRSPSLPSSGYSEQLAICDAQLAICDADTMPHEDFSEYVSDVDSDAVLVIKDDSVALVNDDNRECNQDNLSDCDVDVSTTSSDSESSSVSKAFKVIKQRPWDELFELQVRKDISEPDLLVEPSVEQTFDKCTSLCDVGCNGQFGYNHLVDVTKLARSDDSGKAPQYTSVPLPLNIDRTDIVIKDSDEYLSRYSINEGTAVTTFSDIKLQKVKSDISTIEDKQLYRAQTIVHRASTLCEVPHETTKRVVSLMSHYVHSGYLGYDYIAIRSKKQHVSNTLGYRALVTEVRQWASSFVRDRTSAPWVMDHG